MLVGSFFLAILALLRKRFQAPNLRCNRVRETWATSKLSTIQENYIALPNQFTKNRHLAKQYISGALARDLLRFCKVTNRKSNVFHLTDLNRLSDILRHDLAAAKALYAEDAPSDAEKLSRQTSCFLSTRNDQGEEQRR